MKPKRSLDNGGQVPDWRSLTEQAAEQTGVLRDDGVLWPLAYRRDGDFAARDNEIYSVAGYVSRVLEQAGVRDVTEWQILGYTFELLVGPEGCCEEVEAHIDQHGWGCALPAPDAADSVGRLVRELGEMCDVAEHRTHGKFAAEIRVTALRAVLAAYGGEAPK